MKKRILIALFAVIAVVAMGLSVPMLSANATDGDETECIPQDAYTSVIEHPAVTHEEIVPGTPGVWANFAPTDPKTFIGPPVWPVEELGKWIVHDKVPGGHEDEPDGVYAKGNPDKGGNWFYKQSGTPDTVIVVVDKEAYTEYVEHPAVTCPEEPVLTCEDEEYVPIGDECESEEPTPEVPVEEPEPEIGSAITVEASCVGDALVTKTYKDGVAVSTDTKNGAARCAVGSDEGPAEPVQEEGF